MNKMLQGEGATKRTKTVSCSLLCWFFSCEVGVPLEFGSSITSGLLSSVCRKAGCYFSLSGALSSMFLAAMKPSGGVSLHMLACQAVFHAETR